ncbi:MAG: response regulator [Betaproteobacteria bacterium]
MKGNPWDEGFCHTTTPPSIFQTGSVFSRVKELKMKMLLLDDHPLVRCALEAVIQSLGREVTVHSVASTAHAQQCLAEAGPFDIALLDLQLPDADSFALLADWREAHPQMRVVIMSAADSVQEALRALEEGAAGFVSKRMAPEVLGQALRRVMSGGTYVPPLATRPVLASLEQASAASSAPIRLHEPQRMSIPEPSLQTAWWPASRLVDTRAGTAVAQAPRGAPLPQLNLTPRQTQVLQLLLQGQPNKLIARQLQLSVETVKDHVASLLRVLGVSSRTQAVVVASQMMSGPGHPSHPSHSEAAHLRPPAVSVIHRAL